MPEGDFVKNAQPGKKKKKTRGNGSGTATRRGNTWTAEITIGLKENGSRIKKTKGGFRTKKEALEYIPELQKRFASSLDKKHANLIANQALLFEELYERFIAQHKERVSKQTIDCYKAAYNYYKDIHQITFTLLNADDFQKCIDKCPKGQRTKENMKALGTLLYKYANQIGISTQRYASFIWFKKEKKETTCAFSEEQVAKIIQAADNGVPYADYIVCLCYTGFRPTELLSLKVEDYDNEEQCLIGGIKTDAGKDRKIPISPKIKKYIENRISKAGSHIFPRIDTGKPMSAEYFRKYCFFKALAEIGIQELPQVGKANKYTPRSCRNTFATFMERVLGAVKEKLTLMGHTSYEMTLKYVRADLSSLREVINKI